MKHLATLTLLLCLLGCQSTPSVNLSKHPLNHPRFQIIDQPRSSWIPGWMYHAEVMTYLFKTESERKLAVSRLEDAGFGDGQTAYLYAEGKNISVNGHVFSSLEEANDYLRERKIQKVLFANAAIFPRAVPDSVKMSGVSFWLIDWRK